MMRQAITDWEILQLIQRGILILPPDKSGVFKWHPRRRRFVRLKTNERHGRKRYQLCLGTFSKGMKRIRTIQANKLHWMIENKTLPEGHVDHWNGDREDDHPENLRDRDPIENSTDNTQRNFRKCEDFFHRKLAEQYGSKGDF